MFGTQCLGWRWLPTVIPIGGEIPSRSSCLATSSRRALSPQHDHSVVATYTTNSVNGPASAQVSCVTSNALHVVALPGNRAVGKHLRTTLAEVALTDVHCKLARGHASGNSRVPIGADKERPVLWWSCHGWSCHRHWWWCCLGHGHRRGCRNRHWRGHNSRCLRGCCWRDGNDLERFAHYWWLALLLDPGTDEQDRNGTQGHEDGCSNQADLLPRRALPNRPVLRLVMRPCRRTHLGVTVLFIVQDRIDDLGLVPTGTVLRPH